MSDLFATGTNVVSACNASSHNAVDYDDTTKNLEYAIYVSCEHSVEIWLLKMVRTSLRHVIDLEQLKLAVLEKVIMEFRNREPLRKAFLIDGILPDQLQTIRSYCFVATDHMATNAVRSALCGKRGGNNPSVILDSFDEPIDRHATPVELVEGADTADKIRSLLDDDQRRILLLRQSGCKDIEIATEMKSTKHKVQRHRAQIKKIASPFFDVATSKSNPHTPH
ncbi:MAG: hypothetical protein ABL921_25445, partial [Pirellula sp.]